MFNWIKNLFRKKPTGSSQAVQPRLAPTYVPRATASMPTPSRLSAEPQRDTFTEAVASDLLDIAINVALTSYTSSRSESESEVVTTRSSSNDIKAGSDVADFSGAGASDSWSGNND
jgi:hypothetical protein